MVMMMMMMLMRYYDNGDDNLLPDYKLLGWPSHLVNMIRTV